MVEIQLGSWQPPSAILAGIVVTRVNIKSRETHMTLWHSFVGYKQQYARDADKTSNHSDPFVIDFDSEIAPTREIKGSILFVDRARNALIQQREGALNRGYVDWKIRAIEYQHLAVKQGGSNWITG
jgi:hypothetical protein